MNKNPRRKTLVWQDSFGLCAPLKKSVCIQEISRLNGPEGHLSVVISGRYNHWVKIIRRFYSEIY